MGIENFILKRCICSKYLSSMECEIKGFEELIMNLIWVIKWSFNFVRAFEHPMITHLVIFM